MHPNVHNTTNSSLLIHHENVLLLHQNLLIISSDEMLTALAQCAFDWTVLPMRSTKDISQVLTVHEVNRLTSFSLVKALSGPYSC